MNSCEAPRKHRASCGGKGAGTDLDLCSPVGSTRLIGRLLHTAEGGLVSHTRNRGNARLTVFDHDGDYDAYLRVLHGGPYRSLAWQSGTASRLGMESALRPPGRPKSGNNGSRHLLDSWTSPPRVDSGPRADRRSAEPGDERAARTQEVECCRVNAIASLLRKSDQVKVTADSLASVAAFECRGGG